MDEKSADLFKNWTHNFRDDYITFLRDQEMMSENSIAAYNDALTQFANWYIDTVGDPPEPKLITSSDLREYKQYLEVVCKRKSATVNHRIFALKRYLQWALDNDMINKMPAFPKKTKRQKLAPRWLDRKEENALIRAVERGGSLRDLAIITTFLECGLRVGELANLELTDIELSERRGTIIIKRGKGNKERVVPVSALARSAIRDYLAQRKSNSPKVFIGQRGPMTEIGIQKMLKKYIYDARLEEKADRPISPHTLRHTCAHNLVVSGVPLDRVAAILGHSSLDTTKLYTIASEDELQLDVDRRLAH